MLIVTLRSTNWQMSISSLLLACKWDVTCVTKFISQEQDSLPDCVCVCVSCAGMQSSRVLLPIVASLAHPSSAWQRHRRIIESLPDPRMSTWCRLQSAKWSKCICGSLSRIGMYRLSMDDLVTEIISVHTHTVTVCLREWH